MSNRNRLWMYFCVMGVFCILFDRGIHAIAGAVAGDCQAAIQSADLNLDGAVDLRDFAEFQNQMGGPVPGWLQELIDGFEEVGVLYSPHYVWSYRYNGERVYYVPPRCCDVMSVLYDVYGVRICHPGGGFSGNGDGQCPDFFDERTDEVLIWEDSAR